MASIYNIQNELQELFNIIEESGGEITEEQIALLDIKQEELNVKLDNYVKAIKSWESDAKACKEEESRIAAVRKKYENRVKRLKDVMLIAVKQFGEEGKTGNKFKELPTIRIFTKSTSSVNVDEDRINIFISAFERYIHEICASGCLYTGEDIDLVGILDSINANCKAEQGDEFKLFTLADITNMKLEITHSMTISDYFRNGGTCLKAYSENRISSVIRNNTPKEDWKNAIQNGEQFDLSIPSVATIESKDSLQMK